MKRIAVFLILIGTALFAYANDKITIHRKNYINDHKDDAIRDMIRTNVPASITMAQACLESNDGRSALARNANNHFGIKCSDWKGPSYIQDDDVKDECFRKYNSTLESYDDHSYFLRSRPRYAFLFQLEITDYKGWARGLKKAGYATDPNYAERLITIIEDNQLFLLDKQKDMQLTASVTTEISESIHSITTKKVYVPTVEPVEAIETRKILLKNGIEYIISKKGDDMRSLAKELQLGYWQLPKYNEMNDDAELNEGQIVFLKPKKKEGASPIYTVKPGDTIFSISQENGIKSKYIYQYNSLNENIRIEPGQQLYLRKVSSKSQS